MSLSWPLNYLVVFVLATVISYLVCFLIRWLVPRLGVGMDQPAPDKIHQRPTPRLGGVAIFIGFACSIIITDYFSDSFNLIQMKSSWGIIIGAFVTMLVGALDDLTVRRGGVPSVVKLIVLLCATLGLAYYGVIIDFPFPQWVNILLTLLWLVGVVSAYNALDNMDGLAGGVAFIAGLTYLAVAIQTGQWAWGVLAAALVGANLGFLRHNFFPARLFMGDSGSFFIGFSLAALGIMGGWSTNPFKASFVPIIILGLPLFDLAYVIIRRQRQGVTHNLKEIIIYNGQDHFSHRLKSVGFTQKQTVLLIYLISFCLSCGAFILRNTARWEAILLLAQYILILGIIFLLTAPSFREAKTK